MKPGEEFEIRCYEYLKNHYNSKNSIFNHEGGMDSTKSDISVIKNGHIDFFIEVKDALAQSGQFVLIPNENNRTFIFSPKNHSTPNEMTNIIIEHMNRNFDKFNTAGTAGKVLNIDTTVFAEWIIKHYQEKNVRYIISYKNGYVIFPIRKFAEYFDIVANYRIKKSGSSEPPKKYFQIVKQSIKNIYPLSDFSENGKKLFVTISEPLTTDRFILENYTYYFSEQSSDVFEIRRLSNTHNMNVIFSIKLIKSQDVYDLYEFENDI